MSPRRRSLPQHRSAPQRWHGALGEALALVLPVHCPGCGEPDQSICPRCLAPLTGPPRLVEDVCGTFPPAWPPGLTGLTLTRYEGPVRRVLHAWKDGGRRDLTPVLARALVPSLTALARAHPAVPLTVVPVPSPARNIRRRGGDLLREAVEQAVPVAAGRPGAGPLVTTPVLRQRRGVADQSGLGARQRLLNLRGALVRTGEVTGRAVVLVDDIVTTGASTAQAQRVLTLGRADVVAVVTVAATPRR